MISSEGLIGGMKVSLHLIFVIKLYKKGTLHYPLMDIKYDYSIRDGHNDTNSGSKYLLHLRLTVNCKLLDHFYFYVKKGVGSSVREFKRNQPVYGVQYLESYLPYVSSVLSSLNVHHRTFI